MPHTHTLAKFHENRSNRFTCSLVTWSTIENSAVL